MLHLKHIDRPMRKLTILSLLLTAWIFYAGCSSSFDTPFQSLIDQGPLPLSSENAFVGSNLFLSQEFARSSNLYNFLKSRGAPQAIELKEKGGPQMHLFYPSDKEYFTGQLVRDELHYEWVVRGPFKLQRNQYRELVRMNLPFHDEPIFSYQRKPFRFKLSAAEILALTPTATPTPTRTPVIKKKPVKVITKLENDPNAPTPTPSMEAWKPLTYDQQAIMMAQGFAERSPTGDVIHTVKGEDETMEKISEWYTGSAANAAQIVQLNGLAEGTVLKPGMRIQIPLKSVKQFKAFK